MASICDQYSDLLFTRESLKEECFSFISELSKIQVNKNDENSMKAKLNVPVVLREFIEKLHEKIELLKLIIEDLGREYVNSQSDWIVVQQVLDVQKEAFELCEQENQSIEEKVNSDVSTVREKFLKRLNDLKKSKKLYAEIKNELEESCKQQNCLADELKKAKLQHHCTLCQIKSLREKESSVKRPTVKMIEDIQAKHDKLAKLLTDSTSTAECLRQKVCQLQSESDIVRKTVKSKLELVKMHDEWSIEQLRTRKQDLEDAVLKFNQTSNDKVINDLQSNISLMANDIDQAKRTIKNLENLIVENLDKTSECKKIIKPSTKLGPSTRNKTQINQTV